MAQYQCPICERVSDLPISPIDETEAKDRIFVAMWLDSALDPVYDKAISHAISNAGYRSIRIDRDREHFNLIDHQMTAQIRRSKCVIADLTHGPDGVRGSVLYEAGYAHGCGIPVIFTCHRERTDTIPFDINHYPYIPWDEANVPEYWHQLVHAILDTVGLGPTFWDD